MSDTKLRVRQIGKARDYIVDNLKLIQSKERRANFRKLLASYQTKFLFNPAAVKYHHNQTGGLMIHTAQVLRYALRFHKSLRKHMPTIKAESVYVAAVLHDLAKTRCYKPIDSVFPPSGVFHPYPFQYNKEWKVEHDIWTLSEAERFGLKLSYDEMMGIMQAHGGWSKLNEPITKLAAIIHCADMLSSQVIKK